ncbi:hypothetical protein A3715_06670 [Oleiphilus sp. HI0009]|nr:MULTISPECIES: NAD(+)/NADH kinase [unclassified Oleiphilus]KZX81681.1 hypothetical protein A3715_06670 [Oleiphilus sp. HI0009]KZY69591.1 hypothetical protein A3739_08585 [Oleiphilus sp. HI0067]KZY70446.1 hypothetical protein A3738_15280 [Oleiphilus sp. HI0066]KZZ62254.1 hypothetical protein A3762_13555 [Oleiphilus sp. HI0125]
MSHSKRFTVALVINPVAGLGGPSGFKGSDAVDTAERARALGITSAIPGKIQQIIEGLSDSLDQIEFLIPSGTMGEDYFTQLDHAKLMYKVVYSAPSETTAQHTQEAVNILSSFSPDLLLFAGGDGTARDVCASINNEQVCLGIPSGVKMHSGVFAITPQAVVSIIKSMLARKLVAVTEAEVRDIDERSFQEGRVVTKHFGELLVPDDQLLVQCVKCSGLPDDQLSLDDIAAFVSETLEDDVLYLFGSGGSLRHIKEFVGIDEPTLLGVDAWYNGECIAKDANEPVLIDLLGNYPKAKLFLSVIGGQGVVLGRGNQQLSVRVLRMLGITNIQFVGTQEKLHALEGKALQVDSGDDALNQEISGYRPILCGYHDYVLYDIAYSA